jgi:hypothetical protein
MQGSVRNWLARRHFLCKGKKKTVSFRGVIKAQDRQAIRIAR